MTGWGRRPDAGRRLRSSRRALRTVRATEPPFEPPPPPPSEHHAPPPPPVHAQGGEHAAPSGALGLQLLPKLLGELETEDFILLLLCWLLYRESGDSDWLIVLGALILG